jgi:hypothetical protein
VAAYQAAMQGQPVGDQAADDDGGQDDDDDDGDGWLVGW